MWEYRIGNKIFPVFFQLPYLTPFADGVPLVESAGGQAVVIVRPAVGNLFPISFPAHAAINMKGFSIVLHLVPVAIVGVAVVDMPEPMLAYILLAVGNAATKFPSDATVKHPLALDVACIPSSLTACLAGVSLPLSCPGFGDLVMPMLNALKIGLVFLRRAKVRIQNSLEMVADLGKPAYGMLTIDGFGSSLHALVKTRTADRDGRYRFTIRQLRSWLCAGRKHEQGQQESCCSQSQQESDANLR